MPRSSVLAVAIAVAIGALAAPRDARAQAGGAEQLVAEGVTLRERGQDKEALEAFTRAFEQGGGPRARAQMALAEQALGRWLDAEAHLGEALASRDEWVEKNRVVLEQSHRAVQQHTGALEVMGGVADAEVRVDGVAVGRLPMGKPARIEAGEHTLEIVAPGYYTVSRRVTVTAASVARETVELRKRTEDGVAATGAAPATGASGAPADPPLTTLAWVGAGLSAAALAGGVIALAVRESRVSAYNVDAACPGLDTVAQPPECEQRIAAADAMKPVGVAFLVAGGVLAATSATLFVLGAKRSNAARVTPTLAPGSYAGVTVEGRF